MDIELWSRSTNHGIPELLLGIVILLVKKEQLLIAFNKQISQHKTKRDVLQLR